MAAKANDVKTASAADAVALDPAALGVLLDGEYREIRDHVRALLERPELSPATPGLSREEHRERVLGQLRTLTGEGVSQYGFPVALGGRGGPGPSVAVFETLAFGDLSLLVKFGVQFGLFGGALLSLGTDDHHERFARPAMTLELPGCFAMTETGHGSNVQAIGTTATYDAAAAEFVIDTPDDSARKDYIGNAARDGRAAVVFAQLDVGGEQHGVHALVVPIRDAKGRPQAGVEIEDCGEKLGLNGVDNGRLRFTAVRVPRVALLNRYGDVSADGVYSSSINDPNKRFFTMLGTLVRGRVSVAGGALSATKVALALAVRYGSRRRQFGAPGQPETVLLDYRMHQRRLLPALATTYALHCAQQDLTAELQRSASDPAFGDEDQRRLEAHAAGLKAIATWHATATIQTCREACGGAGYLAANRLAALKADTDVFTTFEGDNTVLLQLVGKSLLTGYRDHVGDLDPLGLVGFVAGQAFEAVAERTAVRELIGRLADDLIPGREDEHDLRSRDYHLGLFRWREHHIVSGVARRIKRGVDAQLDPWDVFNGCQDHVIAAAHAHVDRVVLESFAAAVERCPDAGVAAVLAELCDLHALATIERERGWYQEHGRISSTRSKAITRVVNQLCADLRPIARELVEAFGIPGTALGAPVAGS